MKISLINYILINVILNQIIYNKKVFLQYFKYASLFNYNFEDKKFLIIYTKNHIINL